jgi:hypothetical protein
LQVCRTDFSRSGSFDRLKPGVHVDPYRRATGGLPQPVQFPFAPFSPG